MWGLGHALVLDHVFDLLLHGHEEEHQPVHEQDRPEHRHVEDAEKGHEERGDKRLARAVPKLKLRKAADKRLVLLVPLRGFRV